MPIPTVTSATPSTGTPTGGQMIYLEGTNFRLPTTPAADVVPAPESPPSVRVTFGGNVSSQVDVISATRILVRVPKRSMPVDVHGVTAQTEAVDIVVENIDDAGVLIPTETVTVLDAYDYVRPGIASNSGPYGLTRLTVALVTLLRSEAVGNTVISTSSDYDPNTNTSKIEVQQTPALVVTGPSVAFNAFFTNRGDYCVESATPGEMYRMRRHRVLNLTYEIIGVTNSMIQLSNMIELLELVVDRNSTLDFELVAGSGETIPIEVHWATDPSYERQTEEGRISDLHVFRASIELRGYPVTTFPGVDQDAVQGAGAEVTDVSLDAPLQIGDNLPATQGAPTRSPPDRDATSQESQ